MGRDRSRSLSSTSSTPRSGTPTPRTRSAAFQHAKQLIRWQQTLGINHEQTINEWALHFKPLIVAANYFYGSLHFVVTIGVGVFLFRKWPDDYPRWRNTLGDRHRDRAHRLPLLAAHAAAPAARTRYGFVDTLAKYPTFWTFNSGAMKKISNQFAAMPSVHCCWALWCACALVPRLKHTWAKLLAALYPVLTVSVIVITANHYFLDAVGGFTIFGIGYVVARLDHPGRARPRSNPTSRTSRERG